MALLFFLSAQPNLSSGLGVIDLVGRKVVHVALYAALCALWWRALRPGLGDERALLAALVVTVLYAISDEYHQGFVEGRNGSPLDVGFDTVGAGLAALTLRRRARPRSGPGAPVAAP
jgi:VanZ family protein